MLPITGGSMRWIGAGACLPGSDVTLTTVSSLTILWVCHVDRPNADVKPRRREPLGGVRGGQHRELVVELGGCAPIPMVTVHV